MQCRCPTSKSRSPRRVRASKSPSPHTSSTPPRRCHKLQIQWKLPLVTLTVPIPGRPKPTETAPSVRAAPLLPFAAEEVMPQVVTGPALVGNLLLCDGTVSASAAKIRMSSAFTNAHGKRCNTSCQEGASVALAPSSKASTMQKTPVTSLCPHAKVVLPLKRTDSGWNRFGLIDLSPPPQCPAARRQDQHVYAGPPLVNHQQEADVSTGQDQQEARKGFCTGPDPVPYVPFLGLPKSTINRVRPAAGRRLPD